MTRGFARMNKERQREIASMGGKAAHAQGTAHKWTTEEASRAGKVGGARSRRRVGDARYPRKKTVQPESVINHREKEGDNL